MARRGAQLIITGPEVEDRERTAVVIRGDGLHSPPPGHVRGGRLLQRAVAHPPSGPPGPGPAADAGPAQGGGSCMCHTPAGATAVLAAVGGYAARYRLGQTWGVTGHERQQPLAGDELLADARAWTTMRSRSRRLHMRSGRGWCRWAGTGRLVHLPLGRPAPVPGCWCCGRPGTCRCRGASGGWRWTGSGAGIWTSRSLGVPGRAAQPDAPAPWWFERAFLGPIVPADFVMARSHLRGLQRRAESRQARRPPPGR
jgi:hypothetical protein